ncbi:hypothetical protein ACFWMS_18080, partial [Peribacillus butanolivorans]|uniref:hypothetical protein n=1 Tax=Peribacillus butanolivorans TaxID=421767 RepID=UPI00365673D9
AQRRRGGSLTARGKRVPGVEINVRIFTTPQKNVDKLDFHRVCLQSETSVYYTLVFHYRKKIQRFAFNLCRSFSKFAFSLCIRFSDGEAEGAGMFTLSGFLFIY